jgi:hypothetical protein
MDSQDMMDPFKRRISPPFLFNLFFVMRLNVVIAIVLFFVTSRVEAQTQLVLLNKERVLARFSYGDDFIYKRKRAKHYTTSAIASVREFSVITFSDTIPFSAIERVSLKGHQRKLPLVSEFLIKGGVLYFIIDELNNIVVQGQKPDLEPSVWKPALIMVASGFIIKLIRKESQRIRYPAKLIAAERGSKFYKSME